MGSTPRASLLWWFSRRGVLSLLLALAGCAPKLELSHGFMRADPERNFLLYLQDNTLVRRQGEKEQRIPLARFCCLPEGALSDSTNFEIFPGGKQAVVFSKQSRGGGGERLAPARGPPQAVWC
ncbi:hypothetical protein JRI60_08075 [Archangium violaceum]|uniref:hypothetical protein n=1 Tax=Archangium violaceum TaxID=83451 RepID=UPI0019508819|nr:hypothetical protein [Archangium violaceum]QRN98973.1 hypothetical protein JRI60_08075 [Archangium violaceum]